MSDLNYLTSQHVIDFVPWVVLGSSDVCFQMDSIFRSPNCYKQWIVSFPGDHRSAFFFSLPGPRYRRTACKCVDEQIHWFISHRSWRPRIELLTGLVLDPAGYGEVLSFSSWLRSTTQYNLTSDPSLRSIPPNHSQSITSLPPLPGAGYPLAGMEDNDDDGVGLN